MIGFIKSTGVKPFLSGSAYLWLAYKHKMKQYFYVSCDNGVTGEPRRKRHKRNRVMSQLVSVKVCNVILFDIILIKKRTLL